MEIEEIYPPYIYSIKYDGEDANEFERLFEDWRDMDGVIGFFEKNKDYLKSKAWSAVCEPEAAAYQVFEEADDLEILFRELYFNAKEESKPDFDSHFKFLDGKYKFEFEYVPMKSYGTESPSFIRLYAIKMGTNRYIIIGGGIKLCKTIQESPYLKDRIIQDIDKVRSWLRCNGIYEEDEFIN